MNGLTERGRLIIVGGHSRNVGKTTLITELLEHLRSPARESGASWTAVKISSHRHAPAESGFSIYEEKEFASEAATGRFLRAGARRALLLRAVNHRMRSAADWIAAELVRGHNVIAESNRLVQYLAADLVVFVANPEIADWKDSSAHCLAAADALVLTGQGELPARYQDLAVRTPRYSLSVATYSGRVEERFQPNCGATSSTCARREFQLK